MMPLNLPPKKWVAGAWRTEQFGLGVYVWWIGAELLVFHWKFYAERARFLPSKG